MIMALLLVFQMAGTSASQENSTSVSHAANISPASLANASSTDANPVSASGMPLQLEGIWSFSLKGTETVLAVLHQQGEVIAGSASSEGARPWNAVLEGTLSAADRLVLNMIYLQNGSLVTLQISGAVQGNVQNQSVLGSYIRVDDQGGFEDGRFTGSRINSDLSAYAPVRLPADENAASAPEKTAATTENGAAPLDTAAKPVSLGNPKYQDVHSLAGMVPESLGVGFVGDGTAGAGAMGLG